jgi:hypothetical protein
MEEWNVIACIFSVKEVWLTTQRQRVSLFDTKWEENHFRAVT